MPEIRLHKARSTLRTAFEQEVTRRRSLYQERDIVMHRLRRLRLMRHKPYIPKGYARQLGGENAVKIPITYRLVQTAVNAIAKGLPTVYVEPFNAADRPKADELGRAANLLLQAWENQSRVPLLYSLYYNLFGDGLGCIKMQAGTWANFPLPQDGMDNDKYLEAVEEYKAMNPLPFSIRTVDPLTFYPPLDEYGRGVRIESGWRNTAEVLKSLRLIPDRNASSLSFTRIPDDAPYPELEFPPGLPPTMRVDELWDDHSCAISIQGADVWVFESEYPDPYTYGFAEPTGVRDPSNVGMSVVYPLYYIAPWIDTTVGVMTAWSLFATPTPYTTQDPIPGLRSTQETKVEMYNPGKMYHFPPGKKPGILSPPPVGDSVLGFLNFLIEAADKGGLPALVSGGGIGSRLPALTFQAAFEAATDRLRPGRDSAERIVSGTIQKAFEIIGMNDIGVKVNGWEYEWADPDNRRRQWAEIRPEEARRKRPISTTLQIDSTQDLIAKGTHAQFMVSAQLWDLAQAMKFSGVKDVTKTKEAIASDTAWRAALPVLAQLVLQSDPDFQAYQAQAMAGATGVEGAPEETTQLGTQTAQGRQMESVGIQRGGAAEGAMVTEPDIGGHGVDYPGQPAGTGRNRAGVPAGRGGGKRGGPTHKPRGARGGNLFGRS